MRPPKMLCFAMVTSFVVLGAPASAQRGSYESDESWLDNCRRGWNGDEDRGRACEVRIVPVRMSGRNIEVDGRTNGSVRVIAWDGNSVRASARIQANARDDDAARDILKDIKVGMDGRRLSSDGPRTARREGWAVSYLIMVPRRFDLRLEATNGSLGVTGVNGRMDLSTQNGSVSLTDVGGDVRARTQNGSLSVQLAGTKWEGAGLTAETQNGSVRMGIPDSYAAVIETETVNGRMNTDFPVTVQGKIGRQLRLPLNGGGTTLRATTVNGSVTLSRR